MFEIRLRLRALGHDGEEEVDEAGEPQEEEQAHKAAPAETGSHGDGGKKRSRLSVKDKVEENYVEVFALSFGDFQNFKLVRSFETLSI